MRTRTIRCAAAAEVDNTVDESEPQRPQKGMGQRKLQAPSMKRCGAELTVMTA